MKVEDYDGNPFTFTNLIIPRSTEGEFIKPYLLKYEMSDEFIQEYLMHNDISQFQGKITQFTLGMMQSNSSPNRAPTDPDNAGDGPSDGSTDPTNDANIECEIQGYSGVTQVGDGGSFQEQCMHYEVTVYSGGEYWYSYVEIDYSDCILVWVNEQSASGSTNCSDTKADGEIPIINEKTDTWPSDLVLFQNIGEKITNISDYLKCFDATKSGSIIIYVDQPTPNSTDTWSGSRLDPNVGHTFISISQGNNTKVLGFYPAKGVYPGISPSSAPALVNDAGHAYNVKIEISVDSSQMASVLSVAKSYEQQNYHLSNYNCTDFGMSISSAAGVTLPDTRGSWPGGGGSNPEILDKI